MRSFIFALLATAITVSPSAWALDNGAAFSATEGKILVKHRDGVVVASVGSRAAAGNQVIVGVDASAQLNMGGCDIMLASGAQFVVPDKAPCGKGEVVFVDGVQFMPVNGSGIADTAAVHGSNTGFMLAAGGLAAAGIVGFAVMSQNDEKENDPASVH